MKYISVVIILFWIPSCTEKNYKIKKNGEYFVQATFIDDSIIDGLAKTYKLDNKLVSISNYNKGVKEGVSINFHSNGKVYDSVSFKNGLENGMHYVYDSSGILGYVDFYLNGHQFGPEIFYNNGLVCKYYFTSFEKFEIYSSLYDSFGRLSSSKGRLINASIYETRLNEGVANGIFCYFIYPPSLNLNYQLILRDTLNRNEEIILRTFNDEIFIDTILQTPKMNYIYSIKACEKDSLNKESKIFYEDLISALY